MTGTVRKRNQYSSNQESDLKHDWNQRHMIQSGKQPLLCSFDELPPWYKASENEYIRYGYRPEMNSKWSCLLSWTYVHNEVFNIYSHFIPAIAFLFGTVITDRTLIWRYPDATILDRAIFTIFVSAGLGTFTLSSLYHTFICHSKYVSDLWLRLDFLGIVSLIFGGFVSGIYMGFYCDPDLQKVYWSMISILSVLSIVLVMHPWFQGREWRTFRVLVFICTGLSGFAPVIHGVVKYGFNQAWKQTGMPYYLLEGAIFLLGSTVYAFRFPESIGPGKYDMWGSSHNIFHVLVVIATLVHFAGIWQAFEYHYQNNRTCAVSW